MKNFKWQTNKLYVMLFNEGRKNVKISIFNELAGTTDHYILKDKNDFMHYWNKPNYKMIIN
jgi:hypothetical protein